MRSLLTTMSELGVNGHKKVAEMLRTNQIVGDKSILARIAEKKNSYKSSAQSYFARKSQPVPVNIISRGFNSILAGGGENAEPIFQGDGVINTIRRIFGMKTKRSTKCFKN